MESLEIGVGGPKELFEVGAGVIIAVRVASLSLTRTIMSSETSYLTLAGVELEAQSAKVLLRSTATVSLRPAGLPSSRNHRLRGDLRVCITGSIAMANRIGPKGSPCGTPQLDQRRVKLRCRREG